MGRRRSFPPCVVLLVQSGTSKTPGKKNNEDAELSQKLIANCASKVNRGLIAQNKSPACLGGGAFSWL